MAITGTHLGRSVRRVGVLVVLTGLVLLAPTASAGIVELGPHWSLTGTDLGLLEMDADRDGGLRVIAGRDGYAARIDAEGRLVRQLNTNTTVDLHAVAVHPRGSTALLAGDDGTLLHWSIDDGAEVTVIDPHDAAGHDLRAAQWVASGQQAYIGSALGGLFSYNSASGVLALVGNKSSTISSIGCHVSADTCAVTSRSDGLATIGRDDSVHWLGGAGVNWLDVACPGHGDACVAIADGLRHTRISLDVAGNGSGAELDTTGTLQLQQTEGEFTGLSLHTETRVLAMLTGTLRLVEIDIVSRGVHRFLDKDGVPVSISGSGGVGTWSQTSAKGLLITRRGDVAPFEPPSVVDDIGGLLGLVIGVILAITVPGVILGLIYMSSPRMQKAYIGWRRRSRERKHGTRYQRARAASSRPSARRGKAKRP